MNDNTENILITAEKCVPTLIMRRLLSTRAFCHFNMLNACTQTHVDANYMLAEPKGMLLLKQSGPDLKVMVGSAGIRQAVGFKCQESYT